MNPQIMSPENVAKLKKEFHFFHSTLHTETSFTDFAHVRSLFLRHNDKVLKQKSTFQQKKFNNLLKDKKPQNDPKKVTFNYSSYVLSKAVMFYQYLLLKGLKFSIRS